jgi:hypothetical protein|uniref:hypothetical protein n=1 Tax=Cephaloticoccus sp. TaxID=1985742 RepID=UPI00404B73B2
MNLFSINSSIAMVLALGCIPFSSAETGLTGDLRETVMDISNGTLPRLRVASDDESPKARLIRVMRGLSRPPISRQDFDDYQKELADLAVGEGAVAEQALYLRARLFQVHRSPHDYERAETLFLELGSRNSASHWAQLGFVKVGLIRLYGSRNHEDRNVRLKAAEAVLTMITEPALKRDLHLQIGWAGLEWEQPLSVVIPHLKAADQEGNLMGIVPEDLVIQIAELSFRNGEISVARAYFERFLQEFPTSIKRYNVEQRLVDVAKVAANTEGAER